MAMIPRRMLAGLLILSSPIAGGCGPKATGTAVYQIQSGDYTIEFDGRQRNTTIGVGKVVMSRDPEDIRIAQGRLQVGPREYGEVARLDKVSVVGGKVSVNGRERAPSAR